MNAAPATQPHLRLVRDDDPPRDGDLIAPAPAASIAGDAVGQVEALRTEITALTAELSLLRRKGETLNFHMSRLDEELRLAARLQQDFLPKSIPQIGRVHFHTLFRPAGYVSGDFYDVMRLDEKNVGFYIADAVGHGVPAALLTMFIKHALATKQITKSGYRLLGAGETMTRLNETLMEQNLSAATFATALYGTINVETLQLTFARGGHPHPILLRANGEVEPLLSDGGLLGVFPGETFDERTVQLAQGDRLLLFTDGIEVIFSD
ncbi:MAG TPA: PP2C family protein-serine/threonine phosphatase, partial [Tepidisphaeraceae bacterium]|nr:PP2C family protein-serine/threonine phosphatase [Tepidisphaeraceae bacterium]